MHVLIVNFSKYSNALMAYAMRHQLNNVFVVSIETGWAAAFWQDRVNFAHEWTSQVGFNWIRLQPAQSFAELIAARNEFPCLRFQWCASLLKGMTILDWLDKCDYQATATVILPKTLFLDPKLQESIEESEAFGGRKLWHPLMHHSESEIDILARDAGFPVWQGPSLECAPCIHHTESTRAQYPADLVRVAELESKLNKSFPQYCVKEKESFFSGYLRGCGNLFGCGF